MDFVESLSNAVSSGFTRAKDTIASAVSPATRAIQTTLPDIATDRGARQLLGTPSEGSGTLSGGKRRRTHRRNRRRHSRRRRGGGNCPVKCPNSADGKHDFSPFVNLGDVKERQCKKCRCVQTA
jgi:hypothetical protein